MPSESRQKIVQALRELIDARLESAGDAAAIAVLLVDAWERALARYPNVEIDPLSYARHVVERLPKEEEAMAALNGMRLEDLYLASACTLGRAAAISVFDQLLSRLSPSLQRLGFDGPLLQDTLQEVRKHLLIPMPGAEPLIAQYRGRGPLAAWVKVTAMRVALRLRRMDRREPAFGDPGRQMAAEQISPELGYLKQVYRDAFRRAFARAIQSLSPRQRTLLLQRHVDGLGTAQIGHLHQVNQATASRWLMRVHAELLGATRSELMAQLDVGTPEVESILRLVRSEMDITLRRLYGE